MTYFMDSSLFLRICIHFVWLVGFTGHFGACRWSECIINAWVYLYLV